MAKQKGKRKIKTDMLNPVNTAPAISKFPIGYNTGIHSFEYSFSQLQTTSPFSSGTACVQYQKVPQSTEMIMPMTMASQMIRSTPTTAPEWMGLLVVRW